MSDIFRKLPASAVTEIIRSIDAVGYGVIRDCVPDHVLEKTRRFVTDQVNRNDGEYIHFTGSDALRETFLTTLAQSPNFNAACHEICRGCLGAEPPPSGFHMVLRCLSGQTGQHHAHHYHYDSYVLTALAPVLMPAEGQPGDLILFPNTRKIRRNYLFNLVDKIFIDNPVTQWALRQAVEARWLKPVRLRMVPGSIYLFCGYRTLHTNEPCDVDKIRSTALMHYVDPHAGSWLRRKLGKAAPT
jgi:hypothetical protein